jgi:hypothetical protein
MQGGIDRTSWPPATPRDSHRPGLPPPPQTLPGLSPRTSVAPVGLEMTDDGEVYGGEQSTASQITASIRVPLRRRRLAGIVIGAIAGCGLILVAAVIAKASHGKSVGAEGQGHEGSGGVVAPAPLTDREGLPTTPSPANAASPPPVVAEVPVTGTVRLQRPAVPGRVWLDGKKLSSPSALVGCGTHQIKISARGRTRTVEVPCGGEIVISK